MRNTLIVAAAFLLCSLNPSQALAWGSVGHRLIMQRAIELLPPELKPFFDANKDEVVMRIVDPDLWRVVGWEDDQDDNGSFQILGRGFNPNGSQRKADFTVNRDASGQQYVPAAAIDEENRFVIGWQDDMDGNGDPLVLVRNLGF